MLERPDIARDSRFDSNTRRVANRPALDGEIASIFGRISRDELVETLRRARIAVASVNSVADLACHKQLRRTIVDSPTGPVNLVVPPVRVRGEQLEVGAAPSVGQHSKALREEFSA